jgi:hypothetical protein
VCFLAEAFEKPTADALKIRDSSWRLATAAASGIAQAKKKASEGHWLTDLIPMRLGWEFGVLFNKQFDIKIIYFFS